MFKSLFSFQGRYGILHLTWVAFFLTFICWFNFAPFGSVIVKNFAGMGADPDAIYGGWGNFGAFGAEFALPLIAGGTACLAGGRRIGGWRSV